jgi:hypothetical protein
VNIVHKLLVQRRMLHRIFWFSLQEPICALLRDKDPSIPTISSIYQVFTSYLLYYAGLLPFFGMKDCVFGIPSDAIPLERLQVFVVDTMADCSRHISLSLSLSLYIYLHQHRINETLK